MDRFPAHLHLEIDLESEPIAGLVTGPRGEARRFNGWIELTEAIEDARAPRSRAARGRSARRLPAPSRLRETLGLFPGAS